MTIRDFLSWPSTSRIAAETSTIPVLPSRRSWCVRQRFFSSLTSLPSLSFLTSGAFSQSFTQALLLPSAAAAASGPPAVAPATGLAAGLAAAAAGLAAGLAAGFAAGAAGLVAAGASCACDGDADSKCCEGDRPADAQYSVCHERQIPCAYEPDTLPAPPLSTHRERYRLRVQALSGALGWGSKARIAAIP